MQKDDEDAQDAQGSELSFRHKADIGPGRTHP